MQTREYECTTRIPDAARPIFSFSLTHILSLFSFLLATLARSAPGDAQTLSPTTKTTTTTTKSRENRIHGIHCNFSRRPLFEIRIMMITTLNARYTRFFLSLSEYFICHSFPLYFITIHPILIQPSRIVFKVIHQSFEFHLQLVVQIKIIFFILFRQVREQKEKVMINLFIFFYPLRATCLIKGKKKYI